MKLGPEDIDNFKLGTEQVDKIMLGTETVWELSGTVDWDLSRMVYKEETTVAFIGELCGLFIDATGTKLFYASDRKDLLERSLSVSYDLSSISSELKNEETSGDYKGFSISEDGLNIMDFHDAEYSMSKTLAIPWDIDDIHNRPYVSKNISDGHRGYVTRDGTHLITINIDTLSYGNSYIRTYICSTPWDASTANEQFSFTVRDWAPFITCINEEGTIMFMHDSRNTTIEQYTLSTPFDYNTMTNTGQKITEIDDVLTMVMSVDGKHLYYAKSDNIIVHYEYQ